MPASTKKLLLINLNIGVISILSLRPFILRALSQTKDVYVNLKQRIVAVELKDGQTLSNDTVKDVIKNAGYDVTSIEISEHSVAHIKAQLESMQEAK